MKVKSILMILCLFAGAGLNQLSAQNFEPKGNSFWVEVNWATHVFCDGEWKDWIRGTMKVHAVEQYNDGILQRQIVQALGEATSLMTGETFKYQEIGKWYPAEELSTYHCNFLGEDGSHYIGSYIVDLSTWTIIFLDFKCL